VFRRVSGEAFSGIKEKEEGILPNVDPRTLATAGEKATEGSRLDEGGRIGETREAGQTELRLCNLASNVQVPAP